mmetsp:Transcript_29667/g.50083  ORF Transcript_29667/g.50083 Transcript_29667/m.50083 type:complete len:283 (-) Transcript_29667:2516-3364(-)
MCCSAWGRYATTSSANAKIFAILIRGTRSLLFTTEIINLSSLTASAKVGDTTAGVPYVTARMDGIEAEICIAAVGHVEGISTYFWAYRVFSIIATRAAVPPPKECPTMVILWYPCSTSRSIASPTPHESSMHSAPRNIPPCALPVTVSIPTLSAAPTPLLLPVAPASPLPVVAPAVAALATVGLGGLLGAAAAAAAAWDSGCCCRWLVVCFVFCCICGDWAGVTGRDVASPCKYTNSVGSSLISTRQSASDFVPRITRSTSFSWWCGLGSRKNNANAGTMVS